ncbi:hypothetical protein AVEN_7002-1 [Araneus ventricosus]|uniref:Reverse transcriptase domain-containing protein n=1 Tax=Araneus ventricosus TaxID=182803 RepID=A0A4Y2JMT7_ARAVE|nr:hypothetical protein AVEN_7002-1 [Araneus ventricosus]
MEKVNDVKSASPLCYYLPHHGVFRPEKTTTKLRVVFNASSPTTSGSSLNEHLLKGLVKEDIFEIMTRFRKHKFAFTIDIQKMYRQILIDPAQRDLLRIIWKDREYADPTEFRIKTVTYGTASAPFLAIRTLKQLALDESSRFPLASDVTQQDAYMDDIVSGASDLDTAKELQSQLHSMLKAGGMTLHKWSSNSKELWNSCASNDQEHQFLSTTEPSVKTLGITWKPTEDTFTFKVSIIEKASCTKRDVLSVIARLYDPLGFIGPVITKAKMFLQKVWQLKVNWDGELPEPLAKQWTHFVGSLKFIEELHIDRFLLADAIKKTILVGFADASQAAYEAVVYMKSISETNSVVMKLIASKSRIAPIKTISIPRLELSACLLSQLVERIIDSLKMKIDDVILHTDSTIALAWINTPPNQLKTFIGNRVSKIQDLTESCKWRHISSHLDHPADIISRGTDPQELAKLTLWWHGPQMSQGSNSDLKRLQSMFSRPPKPLANYLTNEQVTWTFIPPRSPNFGGLWEAGVKSFKHHLKRTVGNSRLTIEQFLTIVIQIEGILNSRPLTPLSSDPDNFEILTPGHFLIGRPINSIPDPDYSDRQDNLLSQWQRLSKMVQIIWKKWKLDYLNNLQARHKWQFEKQNVSINSMVLLEEDNLSPCNWKLGRIHDLIYGSDGKVRVVIVKTPQGVTKRSISKICLLPCE